MKTTVSFSDLMSLEQASESFYHVDQIGKDGAVYRIFLYRLASYTDFLLPGGIESRGIMYRQHDEGWDLVCRPMEKFFNMGENPLTIGLQYDGVHYSMVKEDGSLISSYLDRMGQVCLKTKGSLASDQAVAASLWLADCRWLLAEITQAEMDGYTVNCEWTSPLNRIVVQYNKDSLVVLNARHRETGEYMDREELVKRFSPSVVNLMDIPVEEVAGLQQGEGIVVFFGNQHNPRFVKVKADAYLVLHRLKDGVNQPNALFEAVIHEAVDDLRASFAADEAVQTMISTMEDLVSHAYNHFCAVIDRVVTEHRELGRKDFAITAQAEFAKLIPNDAGSAFSVAMNTYIGRSTRVDEAFIRSAQARIVAEYKAVIATKLQLALADE